MLSPLRRARATSPCWASLPARRSAPPWRSAWRRSPPSASTSPASSAVARCARGARRPPSCPTTTPTCSPTCTWAARPRSRPPSPPRARRGTTGAGRPWEDRVAVFLRAAELLSGPWRHTLNAATMLGQSKTAHQAEIDAACELIDFWRFNAAYAAEIYADQPRLEPRRLEPHGVPAARGLRPRRHAVQLHLDRRQPADGPGDDGRHRGVEARLDEHAERLLRHAPARGGGPAAGGREPGLRPRRRGRRPGVARPTAGRGALHRLDRRLPRDLAHHRRRHRALRRLPAHRRRDRGQGLHPRPRVRRRRRPGRGDDPRRLRVPGAEVLGGLAPLRPALALAGGARAPRRRRRGHHHGRRRGLRQLHGRRHRRGELRHAGEGDRGREGRPGLRDPRRRASATTASATSCARRSSSPPIRRSAPCARSSSGRC